MDNQAHKGYTAAKIEGIEGRLEKQDEILKELAENMKILVKHSARLDDVQNNQADHEVRLRSIEKFKPFIVTLSTIFIAMAGMVATQTVKVMDAAESHKPMTERQHIKATAEAVEMAIRKSRENKND